MTTNKSRLDATLSVATRLQPTARSAGPRQYPRALGEARRRGGGVSRPSFSAKVCMSAPVVPRQSAPCKAGSLSAAVRRGLLLLEYEDKAQRISASWFCHPGYGNSGTCRADQGGPDATGATRAIDGCYLPNPSSPFGGENNLNANQSKP